MADPKFEKWLVEHYAAIKDAMQHNEPELWQAILFGCWCAAGHETAKEVSAMVERHISPHRANDKREG